ncbi:MAG: UbiH/UbiF family hydroxylase [Rhizobiaceae bacterium]|nr:UbiH/UbiF family hydroxylase [Rhizobiaceae bacterium]
MATKPDPVLYPISIIGGGLVGKVATLELASRLNEFGLDDGQKIALIAPRPETKDKRTTAMLMPAIEMYRRLNIWDQILPLTAPLKTMRLIDGSKRLMRAPVTDFRSSEIDLEAFGYNVPNADMLAALNVAIAESQHIDLFESFAEVETIDAQNACLRLDDGTQITSQLLVAADGHQSTTRKAAGIAVNQWSYPQTAIVLNFTHSLPHAGVSAEFHTETGPFTQVPLPPTKSASHRSSLVWLVSPGDVDKLVTMPKEEISNLIEEKLQSSYGKCWVEGSPVAIPMRGMTAKQFGARRTVLIGESGHIFPPIGAQGFNLGMRDLRDLVAVLTARQGDLGRADVTSAFDTKRQFDVKARTAGVDTMNRSLLTNFLPVQFLRATGLSTLGAVPAARKIAMWQGLGMESNIPSVFSGPGKDLLEGFRLRSGKAARSR